MEKLVIGVTSVWTVFMGWLLWFKWDDTAYMSLDQWGTFFSGAFAPLAFLWLVVGYVLQRKEMKAQEVATRTQLNELAKQTKHFETTAKAQKLMSVATFTR